MSNIYLIHDFSPSRVWLYAMLAANKENLAKNNIVLAPFNSWACELVRTHYMLWDTWFKGRPLPKHLVAQYRGIGEILGVNKDVLLLSHAMSQEQHRFFWHNLSSLSALGEYAARAFFVLGSPGFLLENYYREMPGAPADHSVWLHKLIAAIPALIDGFKQRPDAQTCLTTGNNAQTANTPPAPELLAQLSAFLGCDIDPAIPAPVHPLLYRSNMVRRLQAALEVKENSWPGLDSAKTSEALLKTDAGYQTDYLSPLAARQKFAEGALEAEFGKLCGLPALRANKKFYVKAAVNASAPLTASVADAFMSMLNDSDRDNLHARLKNDERLLSPDQVVILNRLEKKASAAKLKTVDVSGEPVVLTVLTMTYNQEKYIRKCLDSVQMQITDFPVRHIVLDHHSEDATPFIVAEYATAHPSVRPVLLSQRRWGENVRGLFSRCHTKYAALCDGDDYFTDPAKLQLQVEYLEKRPDYSFCFHPVASVFDDGRPAAIYPPLQLIPRKKNREYDLADLTRHNFVQTNSAVYRWRFRDELPDWFDGTLMPGDWYWHMLHAETGNFGFIPRIMSVYRRHAQSLYEAASRSTVDLRRAVGMDELYAYRAYRAHFGKRFEGAFDRLAHNVLQEFAIISKIDGDSSLLDGALKAFPEFSSQFLSEA